MSPELPVQTLYVWDVQTGLVGTAPELAGWVEGWPDLYRMPDVLTWRSANGFLGALVLSAIR
jgi:hypothetical protein